MKKILLISMALALASCGGGNGNSGTTPSTSGSEAAMPAGSNGNSQGTPASNSNAPSPEVVQFLAKAYQSGLGEIALATLAEQKTSSQDVRRYARMLVADHSEANNFIRQLAQSENTSLPEAPSAAQTDAQNALSALSGADFDRAFLEHNVTAHQHAVLLFMHEMTECTNEQVRAFAADVLPLLQIHLGLAEEMLASTDPAAYLKIAYRHGLAEILFSRLALQQTASASVRPFAQMLIDQHTELNARIGDLAARKGIMLPDAPSDVDVALRDNLARLSGSDFDKAYISKSVIVNTEDANATTTQAQSGADQDVRAFAAASMSRLADQLRMSSDLYKSMEPSFIGDAFLSNIGEILLAVRALESATDANVRAFAQRMITDHSDANSKLIRLANQQGVPLPQVPPAEFVLLHRMLLARSGADFDRLYMGANVDAHKKAVNKFLYYSANLADPEQRAYAASTLPVLQAHLQESEAIAASLPAAGSSVTPNAPNTSNTSSTPNTSGTPGVGASSASASAGFGS